MAIELNRGERRTFGEFEESISDRTSSCDKKSTWATSSCDPVKVGLDISLLKEAPESYTSPSGKSSRGHEFNDGPKRKRSDRSQAFEEERMEIIEHLKTLH
jgi:hypothetical protein